ncbi:MAG: winged helix-turn-helix domain-containing protein [Methylomonas sp.]|nr:winged helix-turn-helix domain-containing protein [Methylomonas sp.]
MTRLKILLVASNDATQVLASSLEDTGFQVFDTPIGEHALYLLAENAIDLVVLDWLSSDSDAIEFAELLKSSSRHALLPIMMLSDRTEEDDKLRAFEAGVDDFMIKPISARELVARIKAMLRRQLGNETSDRISIGNLVLDTEQRQLFAGNHRLAFSPVEFKLLEFLMRHPNKVHRREHLLEPVWGRSVYIEKRTVDVLIRRIRIRLSENGCRGLIETVRGLGYRFSIPQSED